MTRKNRCLCIPDDKWTIEKINEYVQRRAREAMQIRETAQTYTELSNGLPNLLQFKEMPLADKPLVEVRALIQNDHPFRETVCSNRINCCGLCAYKCAHRCVQDIYQRLYEIVYPIYIGDIALSDAQPLVRLAYQALTDSRTTYDALIGIINAFVGRENYKDYTMEVRQEKTKKGATRNAYNAVTGELDIIQWPSSGLCPYCVPRVLYYNVRREK